MTERGTRVFRLSEKNSLSVTVDPADDLFRKGQTS
jgi:ribose 5-phosphate isomerase